MSNIRTDVDKIKEKAVPILKEAGVTRSAIFGSYAVGENTKDSDVDILVELQKGSSLLDLIRLKRKLEEALNKEVDLLTFNSISPLLKDIVQKNQTPIL